MQPHIKPQMLYRALAITDNPSLAVAYSDHEIGDALDTLVELAVFSSSQVLIAHPVPAPSASMSAEGRPMQLNEEGTSGPNFDPHDDTGMRDLLRALVIDGAFNSQVGHRPGQLVDPHRIPKGDASITSPVVEADPGAIEYRSEQVKLPPTISDNLPPNVKMWAALTLWAVNAIGALIKSKKDRS